MLRTCLECFKGKPLENWFYLLNWKFLKIEFLINLWISEILPLNNSSNFWRSSGSPADNYKLIQQWKWIETVSRCIWKQCATYSLLRICVGCVFCIIDETNCPNDGEWHGSSGKCYFLIHNSMESIQIASAHCSSYGATLFSISNMSEWEFINHLIFTYKYVKSLARLALG